MRRMHSGFLAASLPVLSSLLQVYSMSKNMSKQCFTTWDSKFRETILSKTPQVLERTHSCGFVHRFGRRGWHCCPLKATHLERWTYSCTCTHKRSLIVCTYKSQRFRDVGEHGKDADRLGFSFFGTPLASFTLTEVSFALCTRSTF